MSSLSNSLARTGLALLVAGLVVGGVLAIPTQSPDATVAGQEETPTPTPTPEPPGRLLIGESVYEVTAGETLEINVTLEEVDEGRIAIGDETTRYQLNATVIDADGDGNVTLVFDTAATGPDDTPLSAAGDGDEVRIENETTIGEPLTFTTLPASVTVEGIETDSASILIREPVDRNETATPTPTPTPAETPTPEETPTPMDGQDTETPDGADEDTPGFGIVAAIVALLLAAAVHRLTG